MEIIAKTDLGVLISATKKEVEEILTAVNGIKPSELKIGMKIPAIDYASTILKIKNLPENIIIKNLYYESEKFNNLINSLKEVIDSTKLLED